jgi:hypothetical protein
MTKNLKTRTTLAMSATLLAALTLGVSAPSAGAEAGYGFFGIIPQTEFGQRDVKLFREANPGSMRIGIAWSQVQSGPGRCGPGAFAPGAGIAANNCNWEQTDQIVQIAAQSGVRVLPYLFAPPTWTDSFAKHGTPDNTAVPPIYSAADKAAWKEFVAAAVDRYGPGGKFWQSFGGKDQPATVFQVWNEPSSGTYFAPRPDTKKFAQVLKLASSAINQANKRVKVGLPGVFYTPKASKGGIKMATYYNQLYNIPGIKRFFDYAAIHPYARTIKEFAFQINTLRNIMNRNADRRTKIIISELGWASDGPKGFRLTSTIKGQAKLMRSAFDLLLKNRGRWGIFGVNWYSWRDVPADQAICPACPWTGLLKTNYGKKPAFNVFKSFTH